MALSAQEEMQIRRIVDEVVERRMEEFAIVQAQFLSDRLLEMTDRYVKALLDLGRALGLAGPLAGKEGDRISQLMLAGLKGRQEQP